MTVPEPETPPSVEEQQRLAQLERQLAGQFPDLAGTMRGRRHRAVPRVEWAIMAVLAVALLAVAVVAGGLGLAAAVLVSLAATAGVVGGSRVLRSRAAKAARPRADSTG